MALKSFLTELLYEQGADTFVLIRDDPTISSVACRTRMENSTAEEQQHSLVSCPKSQEQPEVRPHKEVRFHSGCRRHSSPPSYPKRATSMDMLRGGGGGEPSDLVDSNKSQQNALNWWDNGPETNSLNAMITSTNINSDVGHTQQLQQIAREEQRVDDLQSAVSLALSIANPNKMRKKGACNSPRQLVRSLSQYA
eukprot:scaffold9544_cov97-Cylindrotheca_fusiformis.AAC.7